MSNNHWAVFALRDIQTALDCEKYDVASFHIDDAIAAIISQDEQDAAAHQGDSSKSGMSASFGS